MQNETVQKTIAINAAREKVWKVLLNDQYNRIWYAEFGEGTYAETDWKPGSKAIFMDHAGNGMVASIVANLPYEFLSVKYEGVVSDGKEDYESDLAKSVQGGLETYRLSGNKAVTQLAISADMSAQMVMSMSEAWNKALQTIKELAESE